ncbi:hypothetical protein BU25DRAFT_182542 [Macroventuria anomochaeta]|uniref:Uncharacterized protein n=1 Tax=Macroventuria anomochaeta TaxID=301207 RepID=A0ACB6RMW9_9PLEO|nr:uncharacterized protein BU25DRAFT_182542 [Macroventuria anomochaeta]KAF2623083.1 hypothetical protein BU25DRAFT_182542 [Macroventuria anomochaeta]
MDDEIRQINNLNPGNKLCYQKTATNCGVDCITLLWHHQCVQMDQKTKNFNQLKANPQQEEELVQYVISLTEHHFPPTREMIKNLVCGIDKVDVSKTCVILTWLAVNNNHLSLFKAPINLPFVSLHHHLHHHLVPYFN